MTILTPPSFTPAGLSLAHARICHPGEWAVGTVVASSTATGYDATAPDNLMTYDRWKPTATGASWRLDFASRSVNYCAIAAHTMSEEGATLRVDYWDGSVWQEAIAATAITSGAPVLCLFPAVTTTRMRAVFSEICEVGVIRFGTAMEIPQPIYAGHTPAIGARSTEFTSNMSATGEILGTVKRRVSLSAQYQWDHIEASWIRSDWLPMVRASEGEAVFVAWRPDRFGDVAYGVPTGFNAPSNMGINALMSMGMQMTAYAHE